MKNKKILIADDEIGVRESLRLILDNLGYHCDEAMDGRDAYELIKGNSYDYVFLDINMPELTGIELVKQVGKEHPQTIIVIITGYKDINKDFTILAGAHEYVEKPFYSDKIRAIITKYGVRKKGV